MQPRSRLQRHHQAGLLAGLIAGAALTVAMVLLNRLFGVFSLAELTAYAIIALLPLPVFSFFTATLGAAAKQLLLIGALLGQVAAGGALGVLWASLVAPLPGETRPARRFPAFWQPGPGGGLGFALLLFLVLELALLPLLGGGFFGATLDGEIGPNLAAAALEAALYGLVLAAFYRALLAPAPAAAGGRTLTRRQLLRQAGLGLAAVVAGVAAVGALNRRGGAAGGVTDGRGGRVGNGGLPPDPTPIDSFYTISKNFVDPKVEAAGWKLEIGGLVERPYSLTLNEIRALPAVTEYRTLCCISNEVGGDLISNAGWKGVRLKDLLERAGVKPGAVDLALTARDGYTESFPIARALADDPAVIAVYEMNGQPLPDKHGFPLRLLVPDIYGMKNVKWVTKLSVVGTDFKGFWQEQGWSDPAIVKTMSRFDFPRDRALLPAGPARVGGVAFAGARGIARVEVSPDGGRSWTAGQLRRPLGPYTWVLWTADLDLPEGEHTLKVRATDGAGATQTAEPAPPLPDGASGWHTLTVRTANGVQAATGNAGDAAGVATPRQPRNSGIFEP